MFKQIKLYLLFSLLIVFSASAIAQKIDENKPLPVDPNVKIGKLENGFTYYIRQNNMPENRVEMRLVVNAGSVLEDDDQLGLAHFIEHMAFNGTKHFEKNELKNYLEKIGIRFGPELNAYTSYDETVYMLTIPSDSAELLDKGFLVMEDWAHGLTLSEEEIDKERGVIIEEWRLGRGAMQRMREEFMPVVFKGSKYAKRNPIGTKEIIENASYETLRRFYRDWYRPDLMALVVVGDIEPEFAEAKIKEHFNSLEMPENVRPREYFDVEDNDELLTSIVSDKETPYNMILLLTKTDPRPEGTEADYLNSLRYSFVTGMYNRRLAELTELENPPFIGANISYIDLVAKKKDALWSTAVVGEKGLETGLEALLLESERVNRYGYTQGEFNRYKLDLLKRYETAYNERDKTESRVIADEYKRNFIDDEPIPGIAFEYEFVKNNIDKISLEEVNSLATKLFTDNNRVIVLATPENPDIPVPTHEGIVAMAEKVNKKEIDPYADKLVATELMEKLPEPGKIVSERKLEDLEATDIKLSNGARVILKPTDFKNDEVLLSAVSLGGHSVYPNEDHFTALNSDGIIQESGVAEFSSSDISKILAGKSVYVAPSISYNSESMTAQSKTADLESMFQLLFLNFTDPRVDQSAFNSFLTKKKDLYENLWKEPQYYFYDKFYRIKSQDHPRGDYLPKAEDWEGVNFKRAIEIYRDRFADAGNFTFIMVGAFDIDSVKPLIERYIGGLPTIDRQESYVDLGIRPPKGKLVKEIYKGSDPKSLAIVYFEKETDSYNQRDDYMLSALTDVLRIKYVDILREEMSGVYSTRVNASLSKIPYVHASMQITIPCAPESVDSLVSAALTQIEKIQREGVDEETIFKVQEAKKRALETNSQKNKYWLSKIQEAILLGTDFDNLTQENLIDEISSDALQKVAKKYFDTNDYLEVVLYPESAQE